MLVWWYWLIGLVVSFGFAWLCATLAAGKGRSPIVFGICGFFFWIIRLIVVLVIPARRGA